MNETISDFLSSLTNVIISIPQILINGFNFIKNVFMYIPEPFKSIIVTVSTIFAVITALKIIKNIIPAA